METNKKLQNLIGAILKKDYFKLEFGQKIKQKYSVKEYTEVICDITTNSEGQKYIYTTHGATADKIYLERYSPQDNYIIEILGQEPTLNDVLLAFGDRQGRVRLDTSGWIEIMNNIDNNFIRVCKINLEKSIFKQEEETKSKIINLLEDK